MFRGYRLLIIAAGGIAVLSALGTGAYFGALYATNNSQQAAKRADGASNTKQHYPNQIDRDRAGLPNIVERIASAPDPQSTDEKEKRDLAAQEASALWSFWMLVATGFSAIITMIGTGFLLWQIMLTREAVEDTGDATKAMREANEIAKLAQRAWIVIEARPTEISHGNGRFLFNVDLTFKNVGQSPATTLAYNCMMIDRQSDYPGNEWLYNIGGDFTGDHQGASLSPTEGFFISRQFVIENEGEKPLHSTRALLFIGASYETTVLKERRYTLRVFSISKRGSSSLYFQEDGAPLSEREIVTTPFGEGYTT